MRLFYLFTSRNPKNKIARQHNLIYYKQYQGSLRPKNQNSELNLNSTRMIPISDIKMMRQAKSEVLGVFDSGVAAVLPGILIKNKVKLVGCTLTIDGNVFRTTKNVYMVGFGKAVAGMAYAMTQILGSLLKKGILSVPRQPYRKAVGAEFKNLHEYTEIQLQELQMLKRSNVIEYREGAPGNQPDEASLANTKKIVKLANSLTEKDTLIVLISGGGSALLSLPKKSLTSEKKRELCVKLQNAGASITELNRVRKQLSMVKGGGLAKIAYPAKVLAIILSDIVGDPIEFIASGPTCSIIGDNSANEAVEIMKKYNLYDSLEKDIKDLMTDSKQSILEEEEMIKDGQFKHVKNIIIGNNLVALKAARERAKLFDLESIILSNTIEGDVKEISYAYAKFARSVCHVLEKEFCNESEFVNDVLEKNVNILKISSEKLNETFETLMEMGKGKGVLLLFGGEPTVFVEGQGKGGRNQEIALRFSLDWFSEIAKDPRLVKYFVLFFSAGTDGQDGPTDATGAFGEPALRPKMIKIEQELSQQKKQKLSPEDLECIEYKLKQIQKMLPENILKRNDSYSFYSKVANGKYLVKTGLTGTNVMDLHFIYIKHRDCECNIKQENFVCGQDNDLIEEFNFAFDESI